MQKISVQHLRPGMITARNIFTVDGVLLLNSDIMLCERYIDRLKQLGIMSVYIKNPLLKDINIPETIREETRVRATALVQKAFINLRRSARINIRQFKNAANCIVDEVITNRQALIHLTDVRTHDNYTFGHCVNVAVLSTITGLRLGYDRARLKTLAVGALLHDIGKAFVPLEILNKPDRLTSVEMEIMKQHSEIGFDILRHQTEYIPILAAHVAFQHHEKYNGSGYPRNLKGKDIHEYARIAAVADVYDAITSERSYRGAIAPHEAYEIVYSLSESHFDPEILHAFLSNIAIFPLGSFVTLNTGEIALVIKVVPQFPARPTVRVFADAAGNLLPEKRDIDLMEKLTLFISSVLTEKEICRLNVMG
jgi:putative nucleotidyltransferase with HDIG domain